MKKQLIIIGIIVLLITVGLSGCTGNNNSGQTIYNIGDSLVVENIRYTFLSAEWLETGYYSLKIKGENLAKQEVTGYVALLKYEMKNGYIYEHRENFGFGGIGTEFTINPGKEITKTISSSGEIDRDFLPVAKIHIDFRKEGSNPVSYDWLKSIVLNV